MGIDLLNLICSESIWCLSESGRRDLEYIISIGRDMENRDMGAVGKSDLKFLSQFANHVKESDFSYKVDNIGLIAIYGMIFSRWNWWFTDYETLSSEFLAFEKDDRITDIILVEDTPGGMSTGLSEFANLILKSKKNVIAYPLGQAASAGYYIASQAKKIIAADTADVGSIGTVATIVDQTKRLEKAGIKIEEVVSRQTPRKRTDLTTEEGRKELQELVDRNALLFEQAVARGRGVDLETVRKDFGQGAEFIAGEALERGMIDQVSTLKDLIDSLVEKKNIVSSFGMAAMNRKGKIMTENSQEKAVSNDEEIRKAAAREALEQERKRIGLIDAIAKEFSDESPEVQSAARGVIDQNRLDPNATAESVRSGVLQAVVAIQKKMLTDRRESSKELEDRTRQNSNSDRAGNIDEKNQKREIRAKSLAAAMASVGRKGIK